MTKEKREMSVKDRIEIILLFIGLLITAVGVGVAWDALREYKMTNKVSKMSQLQDINPANKYSTY